jgi:hypothetical protein
MAEERDHPVLSYAAPPAVRRGVRWWAVTVVGWFLALSGGTGFAANAAGLVIVWWAVQSGRSRGRTVVVDPMLYRVVPRGLAVGLAILLVGIGLLHRRNRLI